jgi:hypothetical protein
MNDNIRAGRAGCGMEQFLSWSAAVCKMSGDFIADVDMDAHGAAHGK